MGSFPKCRETLTPDVGLDAVSGMRPGGWSSWWRPPNRGWLVGFPRQRSCLMRPGRWGPGPVEKDAASRCVPAPLLRLLRRRLSSTPGCASGPAWQSLLIPPQRQLQWAGGCFLPVEVGEGAWGPNMPQQTLPSTPDIPPLGDSGVSHSQAFWGSLGSCSQVLLSPS